MYWTKKIDQKINSVRPWSSQKAGILSKISSFLPVKFEYTK